MGNTLQKLKFGTDESQSQKLGTDESQPFTCEICIEPMLLPHIKFNNQNLCVHPFCMDCIAKYISAKLEDNIIEIRCPSLNCNQFLDPIGCRNLVDPELFDKWSEKLCEYSVLGLAQCYCPNRNCSALILDECGGIAKRSQCPNCKSLFCFQCKLPWHAGFQCKESEESRDINDVAFGELAERKKWMRCPRCRCFVQLIGGCRIVRCRCSATFCYKCGRRLKGHFDWCVCCSPSVIPLRVLTFSCFLVLLILHCYYIFIKN